MISLVHLCCAPGDLSASIRAKLSAPKRWTPSCISWLVQSCLGRPIRRTYLPICGFKVSSINVSRRSGEWAGLRATFPNKMNCLRNSCTDNGFECARSSTTALETLEINEEGIHKILRKLLAKKPSNRRRCAVTSHIVDNPYSSLDTTKA